MWIFRVQIVHICNLHSHLIPCSSMVRASHWSSEGYRLYTYVTFTHYLSSCSSMVRASHWSSEGYKLYTYVTFTHYLSSCSSMVRTSYCSILYIYFRSLLPFINYNKHCNVPSIYVRRCKTKDQRRQWTRREWWRTAGRWLGCPRTWQCKCQTLEIYGWKG